ncbi:MAG TPA: hypothetical protein VFX10_08650 [Nitrospira sp.]|nr:hypothetical protein [Nitrospira sp.]
MIILNRLLYVITLAVVLSVECAMAEQHQIAFDPQDFRERPVDIRDDGRSAWQATDHCAAVLRTASTEPAPVHDDPRFSAFRSSDGDFSFEGPTAWATPVDPTDSALKVLFVGLADQSRHSVVLLGISRYPGRGAAIEQEIDRLQTNQWTEMLMHENCLVDRRPAHIIVIRDRIAVPMWESEFSAPTLFENFVIVQDESDMYVLEYASTPEFYEAYQPLFHRLVTSFRFHDDQTPSSMSNEGMRTMRIAPYKGEKP